jgi:transcriptional antiterminator
MNTNWQLVFESPLIVISLHGSGKKLSNSSKKNYRKLRKKTNSDIERLIRTNFQMLYRISNKIYYIFITVFNRKNIKSVYYDASKTISLTGEMFLAYFKGPLFCSVFCALNLNKNFKRNHRITLFLTLYFVTYMVQGICQHVYYI